MITYGSQPVDVIPCTDADENAATGAAEVAVGISRVLEGLPGFFQKESLLRVHDFRLTRRKTEEGSVEIVDIAEKAAPFAGRFARLVRPRIVETADVPALEGHFVHRRSALPKLIPKRVNVAGAGEAARHADDRHGRPAARWFGLVPLGSRAGSHLVDQGQRLRRGQLYGLPPFGTRFLSAKTRLTPTKCYD